MTLTLTESSLDITATGLTRPGGIDDEAGIDGGRGLGDGENETYTYTETATRRARVISIVVVHAC